VASLRNYNGSISNLSWFYSPTQTNSSNNIRAVNISITPGKGEVGNWSINYSVIDTDFNEIFPPEPFCIQIEKDRQTRIKKRNA